MEPAEPKKPRLEEEEDLEAIFLEAACSSTPIKSAGHAAAGLVKEEEDEEEEEEEWPLDIFCSDEEEEQQELPLDLLGLDEESIEEFINDVEGVPAEALDNVLPPEVLELVFCRVPFLELWGTCRLVCRRWNRVITRARFLRWRKRYFILKSGRCEEVQEEVDRIMLDAQLSTQSSSLLKCLSEFLSQDFSGVEFGEGTLEALQRHPRYPCAGRILSFSRQQGEEHTGVLETITLLVVCCWNVREVLSILHTLLSSRGGLQPSLCDVSSVSEVFYCLATLLFRMSERQLLPMRFHYNVFYALHVLERAPTPLPREDTDATTSPPAPDQLTPEQWAVINHQLQPGELVKVVALAGTGKTTTLLQYTLLNPDKDFLYLVYNKSVQENASRLFPRNVKCQTCHSLAFNSLKALGLHFGGKLTFNFTPYNASQLISNPPFHKKQKASLFQFSRLVHETLVEFITSADPEITMEHLVSSRRSQDIECIVPVHVLSQSYKQAAVKEAGLIWKRMSDPRDMGVKITHDGYLKVWQLSRPQVRGYSCLLVDEAQDLTPAFMAILAGSPCSKIVVGDPHQQIYGFRGAKDAMQLTLTPASRTFYLTQSFRFGPEVAYVACCLLSYLKGVKSQTLVGGLQPGGVQGQRSGQVGILARFNATLFGEMVNVTSSPQPVRIGFAGGIKGYDLDIMLDIHTLMQAKPREEIKNKFVRGFKSIVALKTYANTAKDLPLSAKIKVCETYRGSLPGKIERIRRMTVSDNTSADIVFSTTHKSKGLEWETVKVCSDYLVVQEDAELLNPTKIDVDERNLLYVAATRAKRNVIMPEVMVKILRLAGETFAFPDPGGEADQSQTVCSVCEVVRPLPKLLLRRTDLQLSRGHVQGGAICGQCASTMLPCLSF